MVDQIAIVTATSPTTATTLDITSSQITDTVKAALFFFGHSTTDGSTTTHGCLGVAFWANDGAVNSPGTSSFTSHYYRALNGITTTADARGYKDTAGFTWVESDATPAVEITVTAVAAIGGGVRLTFGSVVGGVQVKITAVIFAGIARAWSAIQAVTTTLGHTDTGGATAQFQPDLLIVAASDDAFGAAADDCRWALGFVAGTTHSSATIDVDRGTSPTDSDGIVDGVRIASSASPSAGVFQGVTCTIDSTGFNRQVTSGTGSPDISFLAIKFSGAFILKTDNLAVSGSTGLQVFTLGNRPTIVLGMSTLMVSEDTATDGATASSAGFFVFDTTAARAYSGGEREGQTLSGGSPSVAKSYQGDFAVATIADVGTVAQEATRVSMDPTGFTLNFATATAGFLTVLGIQLGEVLTDSEALTDSSALNVGQATQDTETTADSVVLRGVGNTIAADTETISEQAAMVVGLALSETETITENVTLMSISVNRTQADPAGWTYG